MSMESFVGKFRRPINLKNHAAYSGDSLEWMTG